jgi:hypothetical protein
MILSKQWLGMVMILATLNHCGMVDKAQANSTSTNVDHFSAKEMVGYSLIGGGGLLTWISIFAGFAGKSPCERKQDEQSKHECFEREKRDSNNYESIRLGLLGAGLVGVGTGMWMVKTSTTEATGASLQFDGEIWSMTIATSF